MQFLKNLIFPGGFMPHGYCYLWTPSLIGLHVVSDSLIALSYLSITIILVGHIYLYREPTSSRITWLHVSQPPPRLASTSCREESA